MPVTVKGQATTPKPIHDRLGLTLGSGAELEEDVQGWVSLYKAGPENRRPPDPDRFERLKGTATAMEGISTDDLMRALRGDGDRPWWTPKSPST